VGTSEPAFDHAAFSVEDFEAVMAGHVHLLNFEAPAGSNDPAVVLGTEWGTFARPLLFLPTACPFKLPSLQPKSVGDMNPS